jgi:hypothetical protein
MSDYPIDATQWAADRKRHANLDAIALPAAHAGVTMELRDNIVVVLGRNGKTRGKVLIHNLEAGREWDAVALEISDIPSVIAALTKLKGGATSE